MSWKFMDESSVTFQLYVSGPGEFGPNQNPLLSGFFLKQPFLSAANFNPSPSEFWQKESSIRYLNNCQIYYLD